jgi:D-alanyl-lipoteichoic acid acyltransferase DltB (MBOAT superfamily)
VFFPQLIAGPIVHHSEMMPQFSENRRTKFNSTAFSAGLVIFIIGLAKKVGIADNLAPIANHTFDLALQPNQIISTAEAWMGSLAYTMQLYFDFSGYADMAIGIALLFNIRLPLNFNSPYKSLSISDFWRRWHMTLSRFLRDYVYIQLGGNRKGPARRYQALLATMLLGGLWHGASWTFVLWGALHGAYLVINHVWSKYSKQRIFPALAWLLTFLGVVIAWVFFRAENFSSALAILESMFLFEANAKTFDTQSIKCLCFIIGTILICILLPNTQQLMSSKVTPISIYNEEAPINSTSILSRINAISLNWNIVSLCYVVALALMSIVFLLDTTTVNEFIYFQF